MTLTFETLCFRVQITGRAAWVETRDGAAWTLRKQHALPMAEAALDGSSPMSVLKAAVLHFEKTHSGNTSLRDELTANRARAVPAKAETTMPGPRRREETLPRAAVPGRIPAKSQNLRLPLRPPLAAR